jgi:isochorismate hydrolase
MVTSGFPESLRIERSYYVLFGIETHVCVQQTALDLLSEGKHVVLVTEGVSSSRALDRSTAIHRIASAGADLMTAESVLFELMRTTDCGEFKEVSAIAKEISSYSNRNKDSILSSL